MCVWKEWLKFMDDHNNNNEIPGLTIGLWTFMFRRTNKRGSSKSIQIWRLWYHEIICRALTISVYAWQKKRLGYWSSYLGHTLKLVRGRRREVGRFKNQHISEIFEYFDMKLWIYLDCEIFYHVKSIICSLRPCFDHLGSRLCLWKHLSYPDFGGRRMFSSTIIAVYDELLK